MKRNRDLLTWVVVFFFAAESLLPSSGMALGVQSIFHLLLAEIGPIYRPQLDAESAVILEIIEKYGDMNYYDINARLDKWYAGYGKPGAGRLLAVTSDPVIEGDTLLCPLAIFSGGMKGKRFNLTAKRSSARGDLWGPFRLMSVGDIRDPNSTREDGGEDDIPASERKYFAPFIERLKIYAEIRESQVADKEIEYGGTYEAVGTMLRKLLAVAGLSPELYKLYIFKNENKHVEYLRWTDRVYVTTGMLKYITKLPAGEQVPALAFLIAHQVARIKADRNRIDRGEKVSYYDISINSTLSFYKDNYAQTYPLDEDALFLMDKAGFSPGGARAILRSFLKKGEEYDQGSLYGYHPLVPQRLQKIENIFKKHSFRSWKKKTAIPDAVIRELNAQEEYSKAVIRLEDFNKERIEEKLKHVDDFFHLVKESPDYEALLKVMETVFDHVSGFFESKVGETWDFGDDRICEDPSELLKGSETVNFTDKARKEFTENILAAFLGKAKELRKGRKDALNLEIQERLIVEMFAERTVFIDERMSIDRERIFSGSGSAFMEMALRDKLSFLGYYRPTGYLIQPGSTRADLFPGIYFGWKRKKIVPLPEGGRGRGFARMRIRPGRMVQMPVEDTQETDVDEEITGLDDLEALGLGELQSEDGDQDLSDEMPEAVAEDQPELTDGTPAAEGETEEGLLRKYAFRTGNFFVLRLKWREDPSVHVTFLEKYEVKEETVKGPGQALKESILDDLIARIRKGDRDLARDTLLALRKLYYDAGKDPGGDVDSVKGEWYMDQEARVIKAYFEWVRDNGKVREEFYGILELIGISSQFTSFYGMNIFGNDPEEVPDEDKPFIVIRRELLKSIGGDLGFFDKFIDYINREENWRVRRFFSETYEENLDESGYNRDEMSKYRNCPALPAVYAELDKNLAVLDKIHNNVFLPRELDRFGNREEREQLSDIGYIDIGLLVALEDLKNRRGVRPGAEAADYWIQVFDFYKTKGGLSVNSGSMGNQISINAFFREILFMPAGERDAYLKVKMDLISGKYAIEGLSELPVALQMLVLACYYAGPVPVEYFIDKGNVFSVKRAFEADGILVADMFKEREEDDGEEKAILAKLLPDGEFPAEDIRIFLVFLNKIGPRMHERFDVQLGQDLSLYDEKIDAMEKSSGYRDTITRQLGPFSTWNEYTQIFAAYYLQMTDAAGHPGLMDSFERNGDHFNLFWGESLNLKKSMGNAVNWGAGRRGDEEDDGDHGKDERDTGYLYSRHSNAWHLYKELMKARKTLEYDDDPRILKRFREVEESEEGFEYWVERTLESYPPTVYRNYMLWAVFVMKCLSLHEGMDPDKAFELEFMKRFVWERPEAERAGIIEKLARIKGHLIYDWRVEALNAGIVSANIALLSSSRGKRGVRRRDVAKREREGRARPLYTTFGGPESQLDLFASMLYSPDLEKKAASKEISFRDKLALILADMPRRKNNELDGLIDSALESTPDMGLEELSAVLDIEKTRGYFKGDKVVMAVLAGDLGIGKKDLNRSLFFSPLLREKWAFKALEMEHYTRPGDFDTVKKELARITHYFPDFGYFRDGILHALINRKEEVQRKLDPRVNKGCETEEELRDVESLLLEKKENMSDSKVKNRILGRDAISAYFRLASPECKEALLEWLLGWSPGKRKPPELMEFEYRFGIDTTKFRDQLLNVSDGDVYEGVREYSLRYILDTVIDSFVDDTDTIQNFSDQMLRSVISRSAKDTTFELYQGVMDGIIDSPYREKKKAVLLEMAIEWINIKMSKKNYSDAEVEAKMLGAFFQANGFVGVKAAQILSNTTVREDISPEIRKVLGTLKAGVKPMGKDVAFNILDEVLPGGFKANFKRLIGGPKGSASLKVAYLAEDHNGRLKLIKIKRPEVVSNLEEDMDFFKDLIGSAGNGFESAGFEIPPDLISSVDKQLKEELDFEKEKRDQEELRRILRKRQKRGFKFSVPEGYEIYGNTVFVEEFIDGELLRDLKERGIKPGKIERECRRELLTQVFDDGVFHLDPHDGNIIVKNKHEAVFIDNSLGRIKKEFRYPLMVFLMHLFPNRFVNWLGGGFGGMEDMLMKLARDKDPGKGSVDTVKIFAELKEKLKNKTWGTSVAKIFVETVFFLERNGLEFDDDIGALKKFFVSADYLVSKADIWDAPFMARLMFKVWRGRGEKGIVDGGSWIGDRGVADVDESMGQGSGRIEHRAGGMEHGEGSREQVVKKEMNLETFLPLSLRASAHLRDTISRACKAYGYEGDEFRAKYPVDIVVDLSLIPEDEKEIYAETWALLMIGCVKFPNVNFVFKYYDDESEGKVLPENLSSRRPGAVMAETFIALVRHKINEKDHLFKNGGDREKLISERLGAKKNPGSSEINICSDGYLSWLSDNGLAIKENQYPVAMSGENSAVKGNALRDFNAALAIGLAKSVLVIANEKMRENDIYGDEYRDIKERVLSKLNLLYSAILGKKNPIRDETLEHMIDPVATVRQNHAIALALPAKRFPLERLKEIHSEITNFLTAA